MDFKKYMHVEKLGRPEVDGLLDGEVYVFPKLDGTNASVWFTKNGIRCGSRNRDLTSGDDNAGFREAASKDERLQKFFEKYPEVRLYGEWLVPHTLRTYADETWRKFYIFDVYKDDLPLHYEIYKPMLDEFELDYIVPLFKCENPSSDRIYDSLEKNTFLIEDGKGSGEGVVVKNYSFVNRFGRVVWGKVVSNEFKTKHTKTQGVTEVKEKFTIEEAIAEEYVNEVLVQKTVSKIENDNERGFEGIDIPRLLNTVFHDVVVEDMWVIIKNKKNPTVNFKKLQNFVYKETKKHLENIERKRV